MLHDVNGDGCLDVPALGWLNPTPRRAPLYVRVLGRNRVANQHGAIVCLRVAGSSLTAGCRIIDGGGGDGQAPYDVHFGGLTAPAYDVDVRFVNGHHHGPGTAAAFAAIASPSIAVAYPSGALVVRDVPSLAAVAVYPRSGLIGIGGAVVVVVTAAWAEARLRPWLPACCVVNGVNVSSSFVSYGNGSYGLTYVARAGDSDWSNRPPALLLALADAAFPDAYSDVASSSALPAGVYGNLSLDAHAPWVTRLDLVQWNATVRPTNNETFAFACGVVTSEPLGCVVKYRFTGVSGVSAVDRSAVPTGPTTAVVNTSFATAAAPRMEVWAVDAAGNVGPVVVYVWTVDSVLPVTGWPASVDNVTVTRATTLELLLTCNRVQNDCEYTYSLDQQPYIAVGSSGGGSAPTTDAADTASMLQTSVQLVTPQLTNAQVCAERARYGLRPPPLGVFWHVLWGVHAVLIFLCV